MQKVDFRKGILAVVAVVSAVVAFGGLEQDFVAAVKAGEPLNAEQAFKALVAERPNVSPLLYYHAAEVARQMGNGTLRRDRLAHYVRAEKQWNATVERAAWWLCRHGGTSEQYARLVGSVPASRELFDVGYTLLRSALQAKRVPEMLALGETMLAKFPERRREVYVAVLRLFWEASHPLVTTTVQRLLMQYPCKDMGDWASDYWNLRWQLANLAEQLPPDFRLELCLKWGVVLPPEVFAPVNRFDFSDKNKEFCQKMAKLFREAEPLVFKPGCGAQANTLVACESQLAKHLYRPSQTNEQAAAFFALLGKQAATYEKDKVDYGALRDRSWQMNQAGLFNNGKVDYIAKLRAEHPDWLNDTLLIEWSGLGAAADKAKSAKPITDFMAKNPKRAGSARWIFRKQLASYGAAAETFKTLEGGFTANVNGRGLDLWDTLDTLQRCKATDVEKISFLKKMNTFVGDGCGGFFPALKKNAAAMEKRGIKFLAAKDGQTYLSSINEKAQPSDKLVCQEREMAALRRGKGNVAPDRAHALMKEVFDDYKAVYPQANRPQNDRINSIINTYYELCRYELRSSEKFAETVGPRFGKQKDARWDLLGSIQWNLREKPELSLETLSRRAIGTDNPDIYSGVALPLKTEKLPPAVNLDKMNSDPFYEFLRANLAHRGDERDPVRFTPALRTQVIAKFFQRFNAGEFATRRDDAAAGVLSWLGVYAATNSLMKGFPYDKVAGELLGDDPAKHPLTTARFMTVASAGGRLDGYLKKYLANVNGRKPAERVNAAVNLLRVGWPAANYKAILKDVMLPAMKAVTLADARNVRLAGGDSDWWSRYDWMFDKPLKEDQEAQQLKADVNCEMARLHILDAEGLTWDWGRRAWALNTAYGRALAKTNTIEMVKYARELGENSFAWNNGWWPSFRDVIAKTRDAQAWQPLYLLVSGIPGNFTAGEVPAFAARSRAEASTHLKGIYPVDERDPSYPLYVAADELSRKNSERAWQIMKEPRNQAVFEREFAKMPPDFLIWAVEQLRMARGDKDALLLKARQIASAVLAQEAKFSPEVAAAMILSRAEGYRDQQNFEAAKLEYQSIRENATYHATKYGKKAMFRAVDLQIAMGNTQGVDQILEYWLSQNDREVQAEAHYFLAKLAFERKDFDECIKQLRQVFAINYTHTEGRFLHGEWKLATNSEVDDTDVLVGDLSERDMITPGNQLTVSVQDSNLSVAGGGASIPVIVKAEPGGDVEHVNLYPSNRDPSNFKGLVAVELGKANPSNRVLEVRGDDTVSYVIDPAFLKARGLPKSNPKKLRVIDDGKIVIGAGAPRAEEKDTEKDLSELLEEGAGEATAVRRLLRPGNPLYIVVKDRDCSRGGEADAVHVSIETSSGDRLQSFELKEEKPFSGVFRGKVETSLPPPRAFASDSGAGLNPGDVINKNKSAGWKSLADGRPGKWFEVDTMGSHIFSEINLETPSKDDIKMIRLIGRMGSKVMTLGQYPEGGKLSKVYLRRQQWTVRDPSRLRSIGQQRAFCQTDKAPKSYVVEQLMHRKMAKTSDGDWQCTLYQGPFLLPEGISTLRLKFSPNSTDKSAMANLWVALAIDGEEVFLGQGCKLQDASASADITPGCHQFELAVVSRTAKDDFDLMWMPDGKDAVQLPGDWFSEEKHPMLLNFVKDKAKIERTPTGFKATFEKPERLRSFRWEFSDVKSQEVGISRITALDNNKETVLPVESDFSDSQSNGTLEVAPGDRITVRYEDVRTTSGEKRVLQRDMNSSFNNATMRFVFEAPDANGVLTAYDAFRFQPGDALVLAVDDPDADISDEPDKVEVTVKNAAGETFKRVLTETRPKWHGEDEDAQGLHTGKFLGLLRTCEEGNTNAPAKVLRVKSDDLLTVSYEDRENTDPGVPCERTAKIFAARPAQPALTLFTISKMQEIDRSPEAKLALERIRRRPGNENVKAIYRDVLTATPMSAAELATTNPIPFNVAAGAIPIRVNDRSRARHGGSTVTVTALAHSEIAKAAEEGREPKPEKCVLRLGTSVPPFRLLRGAESAKEVQKNGTFSGVIALSLGPLDPNAPVDRRVPTLCVSGSDKIDITVLSEAGEPVVTRTLKLVSDAKMALMDSSFEASRDQAHVGESFYLMVDDADHDTTEEADHVSGEVVSLKTGMKRPLTLTETTPHSGVFTGHLKPVMFAKGETIPSVATGGVASANQILTEDRFSVGYGDKLVFRYKDDQTLPGTPVRTLAVTGSVFRGSNGDVRLFSKRFTDRDTAVLVQFRLAECLFEQAKEHRKLKQPEKSAAAIAEGKYILEEALKSHPDSSLVVQGEYLLANLYQELGSEQKEAGEDEKARPLFQEALSRFSQILGTWPDGEYAARSQYHKAYCLEMLKDYGRASEEYVKMTYLYPESELVGEATIRLATYYYTKEKRFDISGHIYKNFQQRFPQHEKAARALFMAGSCYIKQAQAFEEEAEVGVNLKRSQVDALKRKADDFYRQAVETFLKLVEAYRDSPPNLRAQTLYWAGDVCVRRKDYANAYRHLKRTVFEFPETEWARRARGLLLQEGDNIKVEE